ncbi:iron-siderophore ABC transporter substrate-binding protein [Thermococcus eurythermalis]|uniref:Iron-siderophore ABC transporter substrate-binding protein n=1 Tax=Thermococcus eurythermalis TaxID=1505907 RepID=A0A097QW24_9EURY|nr:ABC transporter substrate-binding protein [Thermococcus eurythermalis]AIU70673.1 iron-siderophore ABC transporter substrate-binding protein [Thermococcus eurythermalis]
MRKVASLFIISVLILSVLSGGCISSETSTSKTSNTSYTTASVSLSASSKEVVLTLVGPDGTKKSLTFENLREFPQVAGRGGLRTKKGSIKNVGVYKGVALVDLLKKFGWLSEGHNYIIKAADGYTLTVDYDFLLGKGVPLYDEAGNPTNGSMVPILAYEFNGTPIEFALDGKTYTLKLALVGNETLITPGNRWVKAVVEIDVVRKSSSGETEGDAGYVIVKDFRNRTVKVKQPVNRMVSLYGLATQMVYFLGVEDGKKIVGSTPLAINDQFIALIDPDVKSRMVFVGSPKSANIETVKGLNPDVVLTAYWGDENINKALEGLGIPVIALNLETMDSYLKSLEIVGDVLGKEEKAKEAVSYYREAVAFVTNRTSKASGRPRVLLIQYSMKDKAFKAPGKEYFQNRMIEMAGGDSVSKDLPGGWNTINVEQVAKWNPDVIIVVSYSPKKPAPEIKRELLSDPAWSQIKAVKEGKVYAMPNDGESWDYPAPKWVLGLYWLAKVLHPELFSDLDVKAKADEFYERWYGINPSDVNIVGDMP